MTAMIQCPLRRFVTDGLRDTIDSYTAATLPLHRLAWELDARLGTLGELTGLSHWRALQVLRAAAGVVAGLDAQLRVSGRAELSPGEGHQLAGALATLRATLARLEPDDPVDPVDPVAPRPAVLALVSRPTRRITGTHPALIA